MSVREIKNRRGTKPGPPRERCPRADGKPGKMKFASKAKARKAARHEHDQRGANLHIYLCPKCETWHLTSLRQP